MAEKVQNCRVVIYTTLTCPYSRSVRDFLKKHRIKFTDHDVTTDRVQAQIMVDMSGQLGVPVIVIQTENAGKEVIVGYDEPKLKKTLNIS